MTAEKAGMGPLRIAVLGGGLAGLCAAWNLVLDGHEVTIIEKETSLGGLSRSIKRSGFAYDLGPHNIHTRHESVLNFIESAIKQDLLEQRPVAEIYFRRRWVPYPLIGLHAFTSIGLLDAIACGVDFFLTRFKAFFTRELDKPGDNYRSWIVRRFGKRLYDIYFAPYTEKVWKIPPEELSAEVARKRLIIPSMFDLIKAVLFKQQLDHPENPNFGKHYYPRRGAQQLVDFFCKGIEETGTKMVCGAIVSRMHMTKGNIRQIEYTIDGKEETLETDFVLSTIPVNQCILTLADIVPQEVVNAAVKLEFTAMKLLFIHVRKEMVFSQHLAYFSEKEFPFNRIYDVSVWSRDMVPLGKTAICCEISCSVGDEIWATSDSELFESSLAALESHGFLKRQEVEDYHVQSITNAYPRFRDGYEKNLDLIFKYLQSEIKNLITFGRQGLFAYINMDDAILVGFRVAEHLKNRRRLMIDYKEFFNKYVKW
jgi:protoporphyrinogen oxidase